MILFSIVNVNENRIYSKIIKPHINLFREIFITRSESSVHQTAEFLKTTLNMVEIIISIDFLLE